MKAYYDVSPLSHDADRPPSEVPEGTTQEEHPRSELRRNGRFDPVLAEHLSCKESLWWTVAFYRAFIQPRCLIPTLGITPTHLEYLLAKALARSVPVVDRCILSSVLQSRYFTSTLGVFHNSP
ncbi:hypothetical protein AVEN_258976-1 [Araneus ventricosus]|uniref:Uncharacterized protein n=1 Tax=Araneus ventricosus TaxID=182803 RepID=A0A4Y2CEJ3_ARAVE|nr:hypothetical protein AVEN_258976-1 [Araneus ventricosus]